MKIPHVAYIGLGDELSKIDVLPFQSIVVLAISSVNAIKCFSARRGSFFDSSTV